MNERLGKLIGPGTTAVGWVEVAIAGIAALIGIAAVHALTGWIAGPQAAVFMVGSMGATAVLLFAVPHGALSQPWPVFGGHLVSAVIGVAAADWIADPALAAGWPSAVRSRPCRYYLASTRPGAPRHWWR